MLTNIITCANPCIIDLGIPFIWTVNLDLILQEGKEVALLQHLCV